MNDLINMILGAVILLMEDNGQNVEKGNKNA
jgi:hypothetical protein